MTRKIVIIAAVLGFIGVALGAFGAHGLEKHVNDVKQITNFNTGVRYHMMHTLALLGVAAVASQLRPKALGVAVWSFVTGIILFSGSLYLYGFTGLKWLGAITPLGGVAFLVGWVALAMSARQSPE